MPKILSEEFLSGKVFYIRLFQIDRWKKRNGDTYSTYFNHCKKSPFHAYEDEYRDQVKNNNDGKRSKVDRKEVSSQLD